MDPLDADPKRRSARFYLAFFGRLHSFAKLALPPRNKISLFPAQGLHMRQHKETLS